MKSYPSNFSNNPDDPASSLPSRDSLPDKGVIVVKAGSSTLTRGTPNGPVLHEERIATLASQLADLRKAGRKVILVTSGAVAAGKGKLGLPGQLTDLTLKQAAAAVGQSALMHTYQTLFDQYGITVAQMLLTRFDLNHRERFLYARNTLMELLRRDVLPIINENDVVAVDELKIGDNDALSLSVAQLADANFLIILTDVRGLYTGPPEDPDSKFIPEIREWLPILDRVGGDSVSGVGTGGMKTKIKVARLSRVTGVFVVIADGKEDCALTRIAQKEPLGTIVWPVKEGESAWRKWIACGSLASGALLIDNGAAEALVHHGKSLLACGITGVEGDFEAGDTVSVKPRGGRELARGLCNLSAKEVQLTIGRQSATLPGAVGRACGDTVIHRNNMLLVERPE